MSPTSISHVVGVVSVFDAAGVVLGCSKYMPISALLAISMSLPQGVPPPMYRV